MASSIACPKHRPVRTVWLVLPEYLSVFVIMLLRTIYECVESIYE